MAYPNVLKDLLILYSTRKTTLNVFSVRQSAGNLFTTQTQQDAVEFLDALLEKYSDIQNVSEIELHYTTRCANKNCNYTNSTSDVINHITLPILQEKSKANTLQTLIKSTFDNWEKIDGKCDKCNGDKLLRKTVVQSKKSILFIQ